MTKKANAFTIVELLIVIVVIAILAAISIVAYRGIQDRANSSSASAKAAQIARQVQVYYAQNDTYPDSLSQAGVTDTAGLSFSSNNTTNPKTYCITATVSTKSYYVSNTNTSPTQGGCAGHGQGGQPALTNYATYPNFTGSGSVATGGNPFSQGTANVINRSVSGNVQTFTVTALSGGNRRAGVSTGVTFPSTIQPNTKYFSSRITVDTTGLAAGTTLRLYYDLYNGPGYSNHVQSFSTTTTSTSATQLVIPPTMLTGTTTRAEPIVWIERGSDWTGNSTVKISQFAIYLTDTPTPATQYYDGDSPSWIWNGTAGASTSTGPAL